MCNYFSCIIDRKYKVHWLKESVSHDNIIKTCKLNDTKLENRDIVRIEIIPKDNEKITRNKRDWNFRVDENETLPDWYTKNREKCEEKCWSAWKISVKINIAIKTETIIVKDNRFVKAYDSATVKAYDSATVEAYDSATVKACGSATVKAYDSATVKAWGSATVKACGSATVKAWGSANIIHFSGTITLKEKAKKINRTKDR